ncbi:uncharacterized protein [Watersipora subatra]|uniref:uncharacterized protein n=1 Tax=Watersipora subatra TaxID=2589382 RepID=UPI00355BF07D
MASVISMECVKEESTFCAQLESAVAPLCDPAIHISQALFSWNDHPPNSFLASETFVRKLDASDSVHHSAIVKESNSLAGINLLEEVILVSCTSSTSILSKQSPSFAICFCNPETVAIQWHQCSSISSVNVAHPLVDGIYVQYENISNLKQSLNVICDDGMLPLNLSIKTPTTRWTTQESLPIDLSIRRKRSSPTPDPLNLSIKRRARMSEPALPFHSEHLPVAVKLEQHFGIVEGMSSSICENGETPEKQDAHLPRRASTSAASLFEHFTTSQTDGASDSPESSTQSGPGSAKSKSHLTQSEASFNALPSSPADIESDETLWSDDSMRGTNVYIIPGTPEELTQDDHALPDEGDKQAGQDMKRRNSFEGSEIEKEQSANVSTQLKHRPSELAESDSSSSSFTSIKRFKPNPVKETTTTKSEMKHYTFSRPPPLFEDVRSSAIDLGLALVDNVYPYFSNKSDCETALAEPMSRNCNKRFADRCLRHLPKVVMRHDPNEFDLASLHKIERHQYVKPPPSKKSVQRWLTHRKKETERLPLVTNQPTTSKTTSVVSPAAVADLDIVVPESPPTESHSRNKGSFTSSNPGILCSSANIYICIDNLGIL